MNSPANVTWKQVFNGFVFCMLISVPQSGNAQESKLAQLQDHDKRQQPNIILIISDDQKWTDYGFMGHNKIKTPNLDRLAKQSVLFRRGYVPQALCRSSLMTLITGRYPHEHRVVGNDPYLIKGRSDRESYAKLNRQMINNIDRFETLADRLTEVGYQSFQSGKWWEGHYSRGGFTHGMTLGMGQHKNGRHGDQGLTIGRKGLKPVFEFIDQACEQETPFFVWYAPFLPHTPHNPPQRLLEKYDDGSIPKKIARYYAMCEWFDESCGQLVNHLDERGIAENTIIAYVCDNGWITSIPGTNTPKDWRSPFAPRSKRSPNESGIRTPIFFHWPGHWKSADRSELATSLDIYPTLLAAAGCKLPPDLPGLNLLPALNGESPIERTRLFGESYSHDVQLVDQPDSSLQHRWVIDDRWKLILNYDTPIQGGNPMYRKIHSTAPQLYDLIADPEEQTNLGPQRPDTVEKLRKQLDAWRSVPNRVIENSR